MMSCSDLYESAYARCEFRRRLSRDALRFMVPHLLAWASSFRDMIDLTYVKIDENRSRKINQLLHDGWLP
jgi:hypothetical protein